MSRLLVVSDTTGLSLRLAGAHDVLDHAAGDPRSLAVTDDVEVVVLDVGDPARALEVADRLRSNGCSTPILIVSGYQTSWAGLAGPLSDSRYVVPLPITREALQAGIDLLLGRGHEATEPIDEPDDQPVGQPVDQPVGQPEDQPVDEQDEGPDGGPGAQAGYPSEHEPEQGRDAEPPLEPREAREPSDRREPFDSFESFAALWATPAPDDGTTHGPALVPSSAQDPAANPVQTLVPVPVTVSELVDQLTGRADELFGIGDTAQLLAEDVLERTHADAVAVLVPDGTRWRAAAGVGLRPLERRIAVPESHWMIQQTIGGGNGIIIDDTDAARTKLAGAPLAAWKHLLAVPVRPVNAVIVLARGQTAEAFTARELALVLPVAEEAAGLLANAVKIRRLARLLAPYDDEPRSR